MQSNHIHPKNFKRGLLATKSLAQVPISVDAAQWGYNASNYDNALLRNSSLDLSLSASPISKKSFPSAGRVQRKA
jgi:hypothetical protein